mmetsp:Transcript_26261/g.56821  ORF Transcript_26261/g.56821 Transcript_26261/m.56821 type:complete len:299 (+) Transcript_26261:134-1030(+)
MPQPCTANCPHHRFPPTVHWPWSPCTLHTCTLAQRPWPPYTAHWPPNTAHWLQCGGLCEVRAYLDTFVPKTSPLSALRMQCGTLPSMMATSPTPAPTACAAVSSLGIMPPVMVPSALSACRDEAGMCCSRRLSLSSTPAMSVSSRNTSAERASATAPAAVSALILRAPPWSSSVPTGAMTGTNPAASRDRSRGAFTLTGSPTRPSRGSFFLPRMRPASRPDKPTVCTPLRLMLLEISLLMEPHSTICATSMVALSVTRRPSTNCVGTLSVFSICAICGPPPCTSTGTKPDLYRAATSA